MACVLKAFYNGVIVGAYGFGIGGPYQGPMPGSTLDLLGTQRHALE